MRSTKPNHEAAYPCSAAPSPQRRRHHRASLLLQAFVDYLRARPTVVDTNSTRDFNDGRAALEGISSRPNSLGGVPAVTLEPLVGTPERTVVYFHGGGYVSGSPPDRYLPLAGAVALAARARVHAVDYRLAPETRFPGPSRIASPPTGRPSNKEQPIPRRSPCSGIPRAATWR